MHSALRPGPGILLLGGAVAFVLLGPLLWPLPPETMDLSARNAPASLAHPLGTDQLGRDLAARLLAGGRVSLAVALMAAMVGTGLGLGIGIAAGMSRRLDGQLMRLTDIFLCLPLLPLLLIAATLFRAPLTAALGAQAGIFTLITLSIGATSWMGTARILRAEVRSVTQRDFIAAAKLSGLHPMRVALHHILPNIAPSLSVSAALAAASAILMESALSFLGLGFPPDLPSWGRLIYEGTPHLGTYPGRALWPGAMIAATAIGVTCLGDALRNLAAPH
ncbi:ABC transporter permease [Roseovarius sp. M141]|uniref:ABC transporter permease n=1 Tax=Roseovarius sp. M141 TaxID=2583806 RepID=UPI0020CDACB7|nr:ABC transporter permease [Roseovarius sp. M141]MCQ0092597.1 ABC transporter permease [Roseovarius sp. M141]